MTNNPENAFRIPTDQEFTDEVLAGVDKLDSLDIVELALDAPLSEGDDSVTFLDEQLEAARDLPDKDRRFFTLDALLSAGIQVETTVMGTPVLIVPIEIAGPEPPKPDDAGDREPRVPIPPSSTDNVSIDVALRSATGVA